MAKRNAILQKVSRSEKSICGKCCHRFVCRAVDNQPCFECNQFVEVVHGRWIEDYDTFIQDNGYESEPIHTGFVCSVCGRHSFAIEPYCHCGAKMDGDGNGTA